MTTTFTLPFLYLSIALVICKHDIMQDIISIRESRCLYYLSCSVKCYHQYIILFERKNKVLNVVKSIDLDLTKHVVKRM